MERRRRVRGEVAKEEGFHVDARGVLAAEERLYVLGEAALVRRGVPGRRLHRRLRRRWRPPRRGRGRRGRRRRGQRRCRGGSGGGAALGPLDHLLELGRLQQQAERRRRGRVAQRRPGRQRERLGAVVVVLERRGAGAVGGGGVRRRRQQQLLRQAAQHRVRVLRRRRRGCHPAGARAEPLDVAAEVEVCDGVQATVLDRRHVVRHRRLLLRRCRRAQQKGSTDTNS